MVVDTLGNHVPGATVNIKHQAGNTIASQVATAEGFNFNSLGEIEVMGFLDADLPPGYRGALITETVFSWPGLGRFVVQGTSYTPGSHIITLYHGLRCLNTPQNSAWRRQYNYIAPEKIATTRLEQIGYITQTMPGIS